jgi:hypothetical protein
MRNFYYLLTSIAIVLVTFIACEKSSIGVDELQTLQKEEVLLAKGAKADKVDICHWDADSGEYFIINIADAAYDKHIAHGDHAPATYYKDADGDGYGSVMFDGVVCEAPAGYVLLNGDFNDDDSSIYPNATEVCGDGIDNNSNGQIDEDCIGCTFDNSGGQQVTIDLSFLYYTAQNSSNSSSLSIEMYDILGVGTPHPITNTNYAESTLILLILEDDGQGGTRIFLANSGTITINSYTNFSGSIDDANFVEVTIDPDNFASTPVLGGETRCLNNYIFEVE